MDYLVHTPDQLGQALRARRKVLGLTQTQTGDRVRIKQDTVSKLELDPASSNISSLLNLLAALDLELVLRPRDADRPDAADLEW